MSVRKPYPYFSQPLRPIHYVGKSGAHVEYTTGRVYTYKITGTKNQIEQEINYLFDEFHPAGYGTFLQEKTDTHAIVTRSHSCD